MQCKKHRCFVHLPERVRHCETDAGICRLQQTPSGSAKPAQCVDSLQSHPSHNNCTDSLEQMCRETPTVWLCPFAMKSLYTTYTLQSQRIIIFSQKNLDPVWTPHQMALQFFMLLLQFPVEGTWISQHVIAPDVHHVGQERKKAFPGTLASFLVTRQVMLICSRYYQAVPAVLLISHELIF